MDNIDDFPKHKLVETELKQCQDHLEELVQERTRELNEMNRKLQSEIEAKQQAQAVLERYQILAENTRDIILFLTSQGKIVEANKAALYAYGYSREELMNMDIFQLREGQEALLAAGQLRRADAEGILFETRHRRKDGSLFPVQISSRGTVIQGERLIFSVIRDISDRKGMEERLRRAAMFDHLTNLPNRYYIEEYLNTKIADGMVSRQGALLFVDLDNFKVVNDCYGHGEGDRTLIHIVECLKQNLKPDDFLARIGGDEFAVFVPEADLETAQNMAKRLLTALEQKDFYPEESSFPVKITASIGLTLVDGAIKLEHLFSYAAAALHSAKEHGKNRLVMILNREDKKRVAQNSEILSLITDALNEGKFRVDLQPVCKAGAGIMHYEALVRMLGRQAEIISPATFIPIAEKYGLMAAVDRWVIIQVCEILKKQKELAIFVNLSGVSLGDDTLLEWIETTIKQGDVDPRRLGFEITESTAVKDLTKVERWISRLKLWGCRFALDDFGVGFSSFSYLQRLPIDFLKIDGSFIRNLDSNSTQRALVQAMNAVAHALGKETIAEFVENEAIWDILRRLQVDYGQGYFLGRPMPPQHYTGGPAFGLDGEK
ncbi:nucleotide cyclase [Lucifera butyrica]|uniref:Nucleotide cyclase n=1 Tax=Lucifera butyrica TaxID=1351585 RepID=A0A498QYY2_9FIRM|nr:EAL domain-containing protein [Lucifera butyrica]VBB05406.1 nucleotide cyclase [Lucifera butyrica]